MVLKLLLKLKQLFAVAFVMKVARRRLYSCLGEGGIPLGSSPAEDLLLLARLIKAVTISAMPI